MSITCILLPATVAIENPWSKQNMTTGVQVSVLIINRVLFLYVLVIVDGLVSDLIIKKINEIVSTERLVNKI